jgi:putative membrane protein
MKTLIRYYLTITLSIFLLTLFIPSFDINGPWQSFLFSTLILTIIYYLLRPLINIILLPIHLLTLNLSQWLVNIFVVFLWSLLSPGVIISAWTVGSVNLGSIHISNLSLPGWGVIIVIGIFLTIVVQFLDWILT